MNKKLLFVLNIIFGLFIILYTLYIRFIVVRLPKNLYFITDFGIKYQLLVIIIISVILSMFNIVNIINILLHRSHKSNLFKDIIVKINKVIDESLFHVYNVITNLIPDVYNKISYISQKFYKYFQDVPETFFLFLSYSIRFVILFSFLIDVFIFFRLEYLYKSLYLLGFLLVIKLLFYILENFSFNLEDVESMLIITPKGTDEKTNLPITSYKLKDEYKSLDIEYYVGQYILCSKITGYLNIYNRYRVVFDSYINVFIHFLYMVGWLYVIYKNLLVFCL